MTPSQKNSHNEKALEALKLIAQFPLDHSSNGDTPVSIARRTVAEITSEPVAGQVSGDGILLRISQLVCETLSKNVSEATKQNLVVKLFQFFMNLRTAQHPQAITPDDRLWDQTLRERDDALDLLTEVAQWLGCTEEWSSAHSHFDCIREAVQHPQATAVEGVVLKSAPALMPYMVATVNSDGEPRAVSVAGESKGFCWRPINGKWVSYQKLTNDQLHTLLTSKGGQ